MKVLFIGDIVGKLGRKVIKKRIPDIVKKYNVDFVIANGENTSHGKGLLKHHYMELLDNGVDVITLGNHYNSKNEINKYIDGQDRIVRPLNLLNHFPGVGSIVYDVNGVSIRVTNLLGTAYMNETVANPYQSILDLISCDNEEQATIHIIDFHAEATGEKIALANSLDGKVSALLGTHTHVQTKDARILENGTAFISDVGMCGEYDSCLGFTKDTVVNKIIYGDTKVFDLHENGTAIFSAIVLDFDDISGKAKSIFSIYDIVEDL